LTWVCADLSRRSVYIKGCRADHCRRKGSSLQVGSGIGVHEQNASFA